MSKFCAAHRTPRAGIDPILGPRRALEVIRLALSAPVRDETIALLLDRERRGRTVMVIDGTGADDDVVEVVERLAELLAGHDDGGALVIASVRPGRGLNAEDGDRWLEAADVAEQAGVELVEWFVLEVRPAAEGDDVIAWSPRDLLAEPPRWRPS